MVPERHTLENIWNRINTHEAVCAERYAEIGRRIGDLEGAHKSNTQYIIRTLIGVAGSLIAALAFVCWFIVTAHH